MKRTVPLLMFIWLLTLTSICFAQADQKQLDELNSKGDKAFKKNHCEEAATYYLQLLQLYTEAKDDSGVKMMQKQLAYCYDYIGDKARDNKNYLRQIEYYRKAIAIDTAKGFNFIKEDLKNAIDTHLPPILNEAAEKARNKKYKEATDLYNQILLADPSNKIARQALTDLPLNKTDKNGGIALLKEKIKAEPGNYEAYVSLERILRQKKDTSALLALLLTMTKKIKGDNLLQVYDDLHDVYANWIKDDRSAEAWYELKVNTLFTGKMKLEEYERKNRENGINTHIDTIIALYQRLWDSKDDQYLPTGVNYALTFLLNPYNKLNTSGADLRKAEILLDHDINVEYKEIIRDKDIIYPKSDYLYGNRAAKEENQKALVCRMLEAKAGIQFLVGDIQEAKQTLEKEAEVLRMRTNKLSYEMQVFLVNMNILSNRLNDPAAAKLYAAKPNDFTPAHFDPKGNLCLRFMHGNDEYYFQMNIIGDKQKVTSDYHSSKQIDEEIEAESAERLKQRIANEEQRVREEYQEQYNNRIKGKKRYVFIIYGAINTFKKDSVQDDFYVNEFFVSPIIVYANKYLSLDEVKQKVYAVYGGDSNDEFMISRGYWHDCDTEDCNNMDVWIYDKDDKWYKPGGFTYEDNPTIHVTGSIIID